MIDRLEQIRNATTTSCKQQFALPEVLNDITKSTRRSPRPYAEIEIPVERYRELKVVRQGLGPPYAHCWNESDAGIRAMAEEEIAALEPRVSAIEEELKLLLLPTVPTTSCGSWRFAPARAATKHRCLRPKCSACTRGLRSSIAGRLK